MDAPPSRPRTAEEQAALQAINGLTTGFLATCALRGATGQAPLHGRTVRMTSDHATYDPVITLPSLFGWFANELASVVALGNDNTWQLFGLIRASERGLVSHYYLYEASSLIGIPPSPYRNGTLMNGGTANIYAAVTKVLERTTTNWSQRVGRHPKKARR